MAYREMEANFGSYQGGANDFSRVAETVSTNIQKITQNVSQLQRYSMQIGTLQDSEKLRDQIHNTTHYTKQLAKETGMAMKELSHMPPSRSPSDQRQERMQKERLTDEFTNSLNNFQTVQKSVAEKEKASIARTRANSGLGNMSNFGITEDRTSDDQFLDKGFSQTRQFLQMEEDVDLELIQEREEAVKKLEGDIMDVNQIFKDLGMLVHEQGEVIDSIEANVESANISTHQDSIEANVESANISTHQGVQQLASARASQSSARRKKCIILIIVLIALGILITVLAVTLKGN